MPFKEWTIDLGDARVYIWRSTDKGELMSFAVILLVCLGDEWECVTRYDCVHGFPHRDVIGKESGLLYKQTFRGLTLEQVFRYAIHDCQKNYERHIRFFQAH